jgi:hypothetical protein
MKLSEIELFLSSLVLRDGFRRLSDKRNPRRGRFLAGRKNPGIARPDVALFPIGRGIGIEFPVRTSDAFASKWSELSFAVARAGFGGD